MLGFFYVFTSSSSSLDLRGGNKLLNTNKHYLRFVFSRRIGKEGGKPLALRQLVVNAKLALSGAYS